MTKHTRPLLSFVAIAAAALSPALAMAQTSAGYTVSGPTVTTYVPLSTGTTVAVSDQSGSSVTLPFDIPFFGTPRNSLGISMNGYATFGSALGVDGNTGIPHNSTSSPTDVMAVWWDDLNTTTGTKVWYQIRGTAPNRTVVVEWKDVIRYGTSNKFSFQLELSETTGRIRMIYGPNTPGNPTASVGVQGQAGQGIAGLSCTTSSSGSCGISNFPTNKMLEFRTPADLVINAYAPDDTVYANVPFAAAIDVQNAGGTDAFAPVVRQYLSTDAILDTATDLAVNPDATAMTLTSGAKQTLVAYATLPASVTPGSYFLFARVNPGNTVVENNTNNNVYGPVPVTVGEPSPDLSIDSVTAPGNVDTGATLQVSGQARNRGNQAVSADVPVTFYLSDNAVVTPSDLVLGTTTITAPLDEGQTQPLSGSFTIPSQLPGGKYWVGACADVDEGLGASGALEEIDETNNCTVGSAVLVNAGVLMVTTGSLVDATQNAPYGERFEAVGGTGQYVWAQSSGELPGGVTLTSTGGLEGTPYVAGSYTFEVEVTSGEETATRSLTLKVQPKDRPLYVSSQTLPAAEFGRGYEQALVAVGGIAPYTWQLAAGSKLPRGLAIASDGYVAGRPFELSSEEATFDVVVEDSAKHQATGTLKLLVVPPSTLRIATSELPTGMLDKSYRQELKAVGGSGQYTFSVVGFQRLARSYGEVSGEKLPQIPPEFGIALNGKELKGTAKQVGLYAITLRVQDDMNSAVEDVTTLPLLISYTDGLELLTMQLPEARVGDPYQVKLTSNAKDGVAVKFVEPCLEQPQSSTDGVSFSCVRDTAHTLPAGLVLAEDGTISGTPTPLVEGAETQIFDFLVMVSDAAGRSDLRSLSIKVRTPPPAKEGCTAVGGEALPLLGGALLLLSALRRRRQP